VQLDMIRFAHPEYLYALALVPALCLMYLLSRKARRRAAVSFGGPVLVGRLSAETSGSKPFWKFVLTSAATGMLVLGASNPQIGTRIEEVHLKGVDIFIALDVSNSMKAQDIKPDRLERAKLEIRSLIQRLSGDRVGLIVFAGEAYTQFPLTTDYSAAEMFLEAVDTDAVPVQGTAIDKAVECAMSSFDFEETTRKVLIVITDGENTEGDGYESAKAAAEKGVILYAIGMGSESGTPIPIYDSKGRQTDFKRDRDGEVVLTRLDPGSLEELVSFGDGEYYPGTTSQDELNEVYDEVNALEKHEFGTREFTDFESRFQYPVAAAILFLILEMFISEKQTRWISRWLKRDER